MGETAQGAGKTAANLILAVPHILSGIFDFSTAGRTPQPPCKNPRWNPAEVIESGL